MKYLSAFALMGLFSFSSYALDSSSPIVQRLSTEQNYALVRNTESNGNCWENLNLKLKVDLHSSNNYVFRVSEYLGFDNDGLPPTNYGCGDDSEVYYFCQNNIVEKSIFSNSVQLGFENVSSINVNEGDPIGCIESGEPYLLNDCDTSSPIVYAAKNDRGVTTFSFTLQFQEKSTGFSIKTLGISTAPQLKLDSNGKGYFEQKDSICNYSLDG